MGGGSFSKDGRPTLPGAYIDFAVTETPAVLANVARTVLVGFTADWGPLKSAVTLGQFSDYLAQYRPDLSFVYTTAPDSGYLAVRQAFEANGEGGAGNVIAYRMGGTSAAKATKTLQNTTPAAAITLTAKYEGALGNQIKVTTQDYAADSTKNQLLVYFNTTLVETYTYVDTDIADLAAQINASSSWLTATSTITGTALATVSSQALTGGDSGRTLLAADYTNAFTDFESQRFGVLCFENLTDSSILASLLTWAQGQQTAGRRFFTVVGGAAAETMASAITSAASLNDENFVRLGAGTYKRLDILDVNGNATQESTAQLAPLVAGILANRGDRLALTYAALPNLDVVSGANCPTASDIAKAYDNGVLCIGRASAAGGGLRLQEGLTTYTSTSTTKPKSIYSKPKYVSFMQALQNDLLVWAETNIIGQTLVNDDTRHSVLAYLQQYLSAKETAGAIQSGWTAVVDPNPTPSDSDNYVAFVISAKFGRSTDQVYFTAALS